VLTFRVSLARVHLSICICMVQKEKEVLALLSRLDVPNVHFTNSPPGMFSFKSLSLVKNWIYTSFILSLLFFWWGGFWVGCGGVWCWYQLPSEDKILNHFFFGCNINTSGDAEQSVHLVAGEGLEAYLPLADMIDISAEVERLSKRLSKMQTEYDGLKARLSSPNVCTHLIVNALRFNMFLHKSLRGSSIDCRPRLMKRRSQVRIPPPSSLM
jgi:hypothetical protein